MDKTVILDQVVGKAVLSNDNISDNITDNITDNTNENIDKKIQIRTLSELRAELVDYTDKTLQEPRYIDNELLDESKYYPLGNIYIYKNPYAYHYIKLPVYYAKETSEILLFIL